LALYSKTRKGKGRSSDKKGEGTFTFHLESEGMLDAHDVLYIPGLKKNFLSVSYMEDRGFSITFSEREGTYTSRKR
jgi:hypothetical protein